MQALSGASEPDPEAVLRPVRRPQQNDPGCLHEEHAQVTVAALGDAPEDGSVSGRHLLGDEAEPGRKIPALANAAPLPIAATIALEMIGPMPGTVMTLRQLSITLRQSLDLIGHGFNSLIELPPVTGKISNDAHHAW